MLPTRDAHVPADGRPVVAPVDDEIVALGLAGDRLVDGALSSSLLSEARSGARRSAASSWPRHMKSWPVQVRRTRLQLSQKLWVIGVMKPSLSAGLLDPHIARRSAGAYRGDPRGCSGP